MNYIAELKSISRNITMCIAELETISENVDQASQVIIDDINAELTMQTNKITSIIRDLHNVSTKENVE